MGTRDVVERFLVEVLGGTGPASPAELVADERTRARTAALRAAFPDLRLEIVAILSEGSLAAGHFVGRGTHVGVFQGVPPTGRSWEAPCTAVFRVEAGRIADAWMTWDQLSLLDQLGALKRADTVSA
jgi:predicted ester cyclase